MLEFASGFDSYVESTGERFAEVAFAVAFRDGGVCSVNVLGPIDINDSIHTSGFLFLCDLDDMQVLIALEGGGEKLNRLVTLYLLVLSIQAALLVAIGIICPLHEIKALLVLTFDLELELELMEHTLDLGGCVWCICLDEVYRRDIRRVSRKQANY